MKHVHNPNKAIYCQYCKKFRSTERQHVDAHIQAIHYNLQDFSNHAYRIFYCWQNDLLPYFYMNKTKNSINESNGFDLENKFDVSINNSYSTNGAEKNYYNRSNPDLLQPREVTFKCLHCEKTYDIVDSLRKHAKNSHNTSLKRYYHLPNFICIIKQNKLQFRKSICSITIAPQFSF